MQLNIKALIVLLPAVLAVSTAAAAIPKVERDDTPHSEAEIIDMWAQVQRRDDAPPTNCAVKRLADHTSHDDHTCNNSGTFTTTTDTDSSKTDGSTKIDYHDQSGNNAGGHNTVDGSNNGGNVKACRRAANFGLGRRHAFGRRSLMHPEAGSGKWGGDQAKSGAASIQGGKQGAGASNIQTTNIQKTTTNNIDNSDHSVTTDNSSSSDNHSKNSYSGGGSGGNYGLMAGASITCRRDNEEFEALESRMEGYGALVLQAVRAVSRRHEESAIEVLARRDMGLVAESLGMRAVEDGQGAPVLSCDYDGCDELLRREAHDLLRAHARDLGFALY